MIALTPANKQFILADETDTVRAVRGRVREAGKAWTYVVVHRGDGRYAVFRLSELIALLQKISASVSVQLLEMPLVEAPGLLDASTHEAIQADGMSLERAKEKARRTPGKRLVLVSDGQVVGVLADDKRSAAINVAWLYAPPLSTASTAASGGSRAKPPPPADDHDARESEPGSDTPGSRAKPTLPADDLVEEAIQLDVAMPPAAEVGKSFDLAVRISPPDTKPLTEDGLTNVASQPGRIFRAGGQTLVRYRVHVSTPDCDVQPDHQDFLLRAGQVSNVLFFQLTPNREGELSIVVTAQQEDESVAASTRVRLVVGLTAQATVPLPDDEMVKFYDTLRTKFNLDDLQDLCFRMTIGWDDLEGTTVSAKSRALIDRCRNRGWVAHLVQTAKAARPDLAL